MLNLTSLALQPKYDIICAMLLVIFGAGASFDHINLRNNPDSYVGMLLTNDLISPKFPYAKQAMIKWPGAVDLLRRLNEKKNMKRNAFNLEDALYEEKQRDITAINLQLLSFNFYVHEIIRSCEQEVRDTTQGNTNYTRLLSLLLQREFDQKYGIALVTFNYDTL